MSTTYNGSHYQTTRLAAAAWAASVLPELDVLGPEEIPAKAAAELEAFCCAEGEQCGDNEPPTCDGEPLDVTEWRAACVQALVRRIEGQ